MLRAIVNLAPYTFADDLADDLAGDNENEQRTAEEVLLSAIDNLTDDKLTRFTIRIAFAGHRGLPREGQFDFLTEAEQAFIPPHINQRGEAKEDEEAHAHPGSFEANPEAPGQEAQTT